MKPLFALVCAVLVGGSVFAQEDAWGGGEGVTGEVLCVAVQADGKVVIGGRFSAVNGQPRQNLARLLPDGTLDPAFPKGEVLGPNGPVAALVILPDGGAVAGGDFTTAGNLVRGDLVKFRADGTADETFGAMEGGVATNGSVAALAVQSDGSLVVGGDFTMFYGQQRRGLAKLDAGGTQVAAETPVPMNGEVLALAPMRPAGVVAGGSFSLPSQSARGIFRSVR